MLRAYCPRCTYQAGVLSVFKGVVLLCDHTVSLSVKEGLESAFLDTVDSTEDMGSRGRCWVRKAVLTTLFFP